MDSIRSIDSTSLNCITHGSANNLPQVLHNAESLGVANRQSLVGALQLGSTLGKASTSHTDSTNGLRLENNVRQMSRKRSSQARCNPPKLHQNSPVARLPTLSLDTAFFADLFDTRASAPRPPNASMCISQIRQL